MKKPLFCVITALVAMLAIAEETKTPAPAQPVTRAQKRREAAARAGGFVVKPGSMQGKIVFIDTQDQLSPTNVQSVIKDLRSLSNFNITYVKAAPGDPTALKAAQNANIAIVIVADEKTPPSLVAQEAGWAVLNVTPLGKSLKTPEAKAKFLDSRYRKQLSRVYSLVCGGGSSSYPGNVMNASSIEEFDLYTEGMPDDLVRAHARCLKALGVTPEIRMLYTRACHAGWAPAPTNDVQREIWNYYHALPSAPMTIKPESSRKK